MVREQGIGTCILSNGTPGMLAAALEHAGIATLVDEVLSVEEVGVFKPDPRSTSWRAGNMAARRIAWSSFSANAWDAQAAHAFGMRVVRVKRADAPDEYGLAATGVPVLRELTGLQDLIA